MPMTHLELVKANFARRSDIQGELRQIDEAATTDKRGRTDTEQAKVDELRTELGDIDARIQQNLEIELRTGEMESSLGSMLAVLDRERGEIQDTRSLGERVTSDEFRAWVDAGAHGTSPVASLRESFRAVTDTTSGATSGGALVRNPRLARPSSAFLDRRVYLMDLLPHIPVGPAPSVEVVADNTPLADIANKAVPTAEGSAKPQGGVTMAVVNEPIANIPVWANITRRAAAFSPTIVGYVDGRLRYGVKRAADNQVINGPGTGATLTGLANRAGIVTYAPGAAEARYKSIRRGIRLMEDVESVPEIIVLNPADAEIFDLSNEATAGLHAVMDVAGESARTAWGMEQVRSTALAAGTALLVDPMQVAVLDAEQVRSYMTDSHASNFTSNILTLLVEADLGIALFATAGVCKITFNGTV